MKKNSVVRHIILFVIAQVVWLSLVGLWIYWYVSNHVVFNRIQGWVASDDLSRPVSWLPFVGGLLMLVALSVALSIIFRNLNLQINIRRMYDNFIANVTHELKSPLSSIQLYLETMQAREVSREQQIEFINMMQQDTERLNQLISSILNIARMEQKKIAHDFHAVSAQDFFEQLIEEARRQFKLVPDQVRVIGKTDSTIIADQNAMQIVMNNLFDNAIKYSQSPVQIDIHISQNLKYVILCFRDHGIGLPPRKQKKVFQKFHRIHDKNSPNVKGTGLGLYWVREIIRYHRGRITVSSKGPGQGTVFTIQLPVHPNVSRRTLKKLKQMSKG
ncbi:MAG: HAMP domain-containing sensor histidine kinase [candidate division KSB1 bacterium]|nr:HAMP domain-containing sensor histidine kinase [candidate division KSB1 bacterium]